MVNVCSVVFLIIPRHKQAQGAATRLRQVFQLPHRLSPRYHKEIGFKVIQKEATHKVSESTF